MEEPAQAGGPATPTTPTDLIRPPKPPKPNQRGGSGLSDLAEWINPIVRGWHQYYGRFTPSVMRAFLARINTYLMRWARGKYRRLRGYWALTRWWKRVQRENPGLFYHWGITRAHQVTR
ncbi:maturase [Kineosporiaceae bacterium SCSIO 59966]|nr:maturase [Kineosporiaceae bacterium SCSIO 59966]